MKRTVEEIAQACNGKITNCAPKKYIDKIVINDKSVVENCLYVAIKGEKFDGNEFSAKA